MEKTDEKLATLIEKLQEAGFAQAPEVIDGAIRAIHWDGMMALVFVGLFILTLLVALILSIKNKDAKPGLIGVLVSLILVIIWSAGNPWLKVFDPQAALYQRIVESIL